MGTVVVAAIFLLACLNVCIGLISCCGTYFAEAFPRVPYRMWALGFAVFSCAVSNVGLDAMPFADLGMNWVFPALVGMVIGVAVSGIRSSAVE